MAHLTLILGGQRSGKSAYSESLIGGAEAVYIATCEALDDEMAERIKRHRDRRGDNWKLVEAPIEAAAALRDNDKAGRVQLLDSLGMWVANLLGADRDVAEETKILVQTLQSLTSPVVIVSDEAGLGVVPDNPLARRFIDALGAANQAIAAEADRAVMVSAGLSVTLKGSDLL